MNEILRPENYGFEKSKRNWDLFFAFSSRVNGYIYGDSNDGDISPVLEVFNNQTELSICEVKLDDMKTRDEVETGIGMFMISHGFDYESYARRNKYLVLRGFDNFVFNNKTRLGEQDVNQAFQVMQLVQKHGHGTMVTFRNDESKDPWQQIVALGRKSYFLDTFITDFAPMTIIRKDYTK